VFASVVAVKNARLGQLKDAAEGDYAVKSAALMRQFHHEAVAELSGAGAVVISASGDTVLAAFGSPLEQSASGKRQAPKHLPLKNAEKDDGCKGGLLRKTEQIQKTVKRAVEIAQKITAQGLKTGPWNTAVDAGLCDFYYAPESGYTAEGRAVTRCRLLVSLAGRYQLPAVISVDAGEDYPSPHYQKPSQPNIDAKTRAIFYEINNPVTSG
jgi:hypothetical protein